MRHFKRAILIAVLPTVHLCLCAYVAVSHDVWNWILLSLIDFPLLYLQKYVGDPFNFAVLGPLRLTVFGTVWWLCIGVALSYIVAWCERKIMMALDEKL
jgi:hypothetical protein